MLRYSGYLMPLLCLLSTPCGVVSQKKFTLLDCVAQELPATVSPRFQECVDESASSGSIFRFINGFECILRLANAIKSDRSVDVATLFLAVGDFKGTRFETAVLECEAPLPAIKFTICMLEKYRQICKKRIVIPRPTKNKVKPDETTEQPAKKIASNTKNKAKRKPRNE